MRSDKYVHGRGHVCDESRGRRGFGGFGFGRGMRGGGFGPGWGARHEGRGHGRRGGGRLFDHGTLRWVLLSLIADKPSHGYELIKAIEARMGGAYTPSPGVIYPSLTLLEDMGAVSVVAEGGKKRYAITDEGRRLLVENAEALAHAERKMKALRGRADRPARIAQAIETFRAAAYERLTQEPPLSEAQVEAIANLIEAAAEKVRQA